MADLHITSAANPRLRSLAGLRRRRAREEQGLTLVEGHDELALVVESGVRPTELYYCRELMGTGQEGLVEVVRGQGVRPVELSRAAFEKVAYREGPDGYLAVVGMTPRAPGELALPPEPLLLVGEGIEKPGNLGAMLRTADAAGVDAVIAASPLTDWGNPNVVRGSKGTVFSVPVASAGTGETLAWLRGRGIRLVATTPHTQTEHTDVDYRGPVAIAVGTEKDGLTDELLAGADERVRIPMVGRVNSLNVATAAAVVVYEAVRQRRQSPQRSES